MEKENNHHQETNIPDNPPSNEPKLVVGLFAGEEDEEHHQCPNPDCGAAWGIEEICFQECFCCGYPDEEEDYNDWEEFEYGYPDEEEDYNDWEEFEYDNYSEEEEAEIRQEEDFYNGIEPLEDEDQECSNDDDLPF